MLASKRIPLSLTLHATDRGELEAGLLRIAKEISAELSLKLHERFPLARLSEVVACIGLTGVTFPYDALLDLPEVVESAELKFAKLICTGDAEIAYASHCLDRAGAASVAHMGSTAYAQSDSRRARYGGWGPALGDEGSAYWIGRRCLRAIGEEYDASKKAANTSQSPLWASVDKWLLSPRVPVASWRLASRTWRTMRSKYESEGYDPRSAVFNLANEMSRAGLPDWRAALSSLAIPVQMASSEDERAAAILNAAGDHLFSQLQSAADLARVDLSKSPILLYGALFAVAPLVKTRVIAKLKHQYGPQVSLVFPGSADTMRPVCGALLYALGSKDSSNLALPSPSIIKSLLSSDPAIHLNGALAND